MHDLVILKRNCELLIKLLCFILQVRRSFIIFSRSLRKQEDMLIGLTLLLFALNKKAKVISPPENYPCESRHYNI